MLSKKYGEIMQLKFVRLTNVSRMALGDKYFSESKSDSSVKLDELREMVNEWFWLNGVFNIGDWIPWLSFLDLQGYVKRIKALYRKLDKFHSYVIDDHKARRAGDKDFVAKDIVDLVLKLADDPNLEVKLTSDCFKGLI
ncbi:Dimethylnonatriene synthase [Camellia lanceoleosa]|uniref:Dimethylnonatriene synthase n=1 Tax=Camellia lanceoleosa TaxID=1840588 RepID=A0ACC0FGB0_9ERIC|nr:Dimethylnonatriene synthase [Camellia lanceoleosa]